jgi:hypothetical protein
MGPMYLTSGGFETAGASGGGGAGGDQERRRRLAAGRDGIGNGNPGYCNCAVGSWELGVAERQSSECDSH